MKELKCYTSTSVRRRRGKSTSLDLWHTLYERDSTFSSTFCADRNRKPFSNDTHHITSVSGLEKWKRKKLDRRMYPAQTSPKAAVLDVRNRYSLEPQRENEKKKRKKRLDSGSTERNSSKRPTMNVCETRAGVKERSPGHSEKESTIGEWS